MSVRQTRRQAALAAANEIETPTKPAAPTPAENGTGNHAVQEREVEVSDASSGENIFLFWPNIIGMTAACCTPAGPCLPPSWQH